jgi:hypothetical protein
LQAEFTVFDRIRGGLVFREPDLESDFEFEVQKLEWEPGHRSGRISKNEHGPRIKTGIRQQVEIPETFESLRCLIKKS